MSFIRELSFYLAWSQNDGPLAVKVVQDAIRDKDQSLLLAFVNDVKVGSAIDGLLATVADKRVVAAWVQVDGRSTTEVEAAFERTGYCKSVAVAVSTRPDLSDDTYRAVLATGSRAVAMQILSSAPASIDVMEAAAAVWAKGLSAGDLFETEIRHRLISLSRLPRQVVRAAWLANRQALTTWVLNNFTLSAAQLRSVTVDSVVADTDKLPDLAAKLTALTKGFACQPAATRETLEGLCRDAREALEAAGPGAGSFIRGVELRSELSPRAAGLTELDAEDLWGPGDEAIAAAMAAGHEALVNEIGRRFVVPWRYLIKRFGALSDQQRAQVVARYPDDVEFQAFLLSSGHGAYLSDSALLNAATLLLETFEKDGTSVPTAALIALEKFPELAGRFPLTTLLSKSAWEGRAAAAVVSKVSAACQTTEDLALLSSIVTGDKKRWAFSGTLNDLVDVFGSIRD